MLVTFVEDFLHSIIQALAAKKTLVQAKELFFAIRDATGANKTSDKLLKVCKDCCKIDLEQNSSITGITAQLFGYLFSEPDARLNLNAFKLLVHQMEMPLISNANIE